MGTGPTARRRRLGAMLVELRERAGKYQKEAADLLGCSVGKIVNIEKGRSGVKKAELVMLLDFYGAYDSELRDFLEVLRKDGTKRGWWSTYGIPEWARPFIGFENDAVSARNFEPLLIPGMLQTKEYALALHQAAGHLVSPEVVDRRVAVRLERQRRLSDDAPLHFWAIIGEEALRRPVGGYTVMAGQLQHLAAAGRQRNIKIQVLPTQVGAFPAMSGGIYLLSFADESYPDVGWVEYPVGGSLIDEPRDVLTMSAVFDDLRALALGVRESAKMVSSIAREHERMSDDKANDNRIRLSLAEE
ncbi:transcriptional regulator [Longimycelium tulufanense]|uniref:Transcriptional regulator n=1 Tax=Longimycelium tulufanense TaxID=907463 RepID=A0A8J3C9E3_9PSEU|nr:helix-turn-helix transcriptional regulator [Longimycelium tulufanense]GGM33759.1 transcriptional regulator [Longimycelium tulufanense]